jgi:hypothetical protein
MRHFYRYTLLSVLAFCVWVVPPLPGQYVISTVAGGPIQTGTPALAVEFRPQAVKLDSSGTLYILDEGTVYRLGTDGRLVVVAGSGVRGYGGDGGPATGALLDQPKGLAACGKGGFF